MRNVYDMLPELRSDHWIRFILTSVTCPGIEIQSRVEHCLDRFFAIADVGAVTTRVIGLTLLLRVDFPADEP